MCRQTSKEDKLSRQSSGGHGSSNTNTAANSPTEESKKSTEDSDNMKKEFLMEKMDKDQIETSKLGQILNSNKQDGHVLCACWCQGWAEIYVRRPTGDMSWIMRIQNSTQFETPMDFPIHDIMALYMPNQDVVSSKQQEATLEDSDDEAEVFPKSIICNLCEKKRIYKISYYRMCQIKVIINHRMNMVQNR